MLFIISIHSFLAKDPPISPTHNDVRSFVGNVLGIFSTVRDVYLSDSIILICIISLEPNRAIIIIVFDKKYIPVFMRNEKHSTAVAVGS